MKEDSLQTRLDEKHMSNSDFTIAIIGPLPRQMQQLIQALGSRQASRIRFINHQTGYARVPSGCRFVVVWIKFISHHQYREVIASVGRDRTIPHHGGVKALAALLSELLATS